MLDKINLGGGIIFLMSSTFAIGRMGRILRYEEYLRAVVFSAVFLFAAPFFAGENRFCLRMGNGGGMGFQNGGADISLVYEYEGRFFRAGGGVQYNAGDINLTGHCLFDVNAQFNTIRWTCSAGSLYHVGFPEKKSVMQDIFFCLAPKLEILPSHTEIRLFGGAGCAAMTLHGGAARPQTFWDFNAFFGAQIFQRIGIVRLQGAVATCSYFRYDFPIVPRISCGVDILCTRSLSLGILTTFQYSEFAENCLNTVLTDFYVQAAIEYVL